MNSSSNELFRDYLNCKFKANLSLMATRAQWRRLFPRAIIGRNEKLNSLTIIEFYETLNEIGID